MNTKLSNILTSVAFALLAVGIVVFCGLVGHHLFGSRGMWFIGSLSACFILPFLGWYLWVCWRPKPRPYREWLTSRDELTDQERQWLEENP